MNPDPQASGIIAIPDSRPFDLLRVSGSESSVEKIARLELENAWLRDRIGELERRLGLNSANSGKPPSSDGLQKPRAERRTRSLRGRTHWLHVMSTPSLAAYRVTQKRGAVPEGVSGIAVHDHWQCYWPMPGVEHALCNAHHLRELQAAVDLDKEAWAGRLQRLLRRAWRVARARAVPERLRARFERTVMLPFSGDGW